MNEKLKPTDWGKGIPNYSKKDEMTSDEIFDMGVEIIRNYLKKEGFSIKIEMPERESIINFLVKKEENTYAISIKTDIAPNIPVISDEDKEQLLNLSKNNKAIPLFASVGFGSIDSERFDVGLALKGDGYYCRFNGFEEIDNSSNIDIDKKNKKERNNKMDEDIINKIAEVFTFDNTSDLGFYVSYRNFCLKNIIRLDFVYGSKKISVQSVPAKSTLSEEASNDRRDIFKKYYSKLHKIDKSKIDDVKKYTMIKYVNGEKEYYDYNEEFEKIFTYGKIDKVNVDPKTISTPYLILDNSRDSYKYKTINFIGNCIKNKDFSSIYKYLSKDCTISINKSIISGINEIKKEVKNRSGFLNSKLRKKSFYNTIMGYLNNNISDVCLKIELTDENYDRSKYVLYFEFTGNNLVKGIKIEPFDENLLMKAIYDEGLEKLLNSKYNDYKNN